MPVYCRCWSGQRFGWRAGHRIGTRHGPRDTRHTTLLRPRLLTEAGTASYLGFHSHTLENWRSAGEGPRWKRLGRSIRYEPADLDAWVDAVAVESTTPVTSAGQRDKRGTQEMGRARLADGETGEEKYTEPKFKSEPWMRVTGGTPSGSRDVPV